VIDLALLLIAWLSGLFGGFGAGFLLGFFATWRRKRGAAP
jgi:hypothetical protein